MPEVPEYVLKVMKKRMKKIHDLSYKQGKIDTIKVLRATFDSMPEDFFKKEIVIEFLDGIKDVK